MRRTRYAGVWHGDDRRACRARLGLAHGCIWDLSEILCVVVIVLHRSDLFGNHARRVSRSFRVGIATVGDGGLR